MIKYIEKIPDYFDLGLFVQGILLLNGSLRVKNVEQKMRPSVHGAPPDPQLAESVPIAPPKKQSNVHGNCKFSNPLLCCIISSLPDSVF